MEEELKKRIEILENIIIQKEKEKNIIDKTQELAENAFDWLFSGFY